MPISVSRTQKEAVNLHQRTQPSNQHANDSRSLNAHVRARGPKWLIWNFNHDRCAPYPNTVVPKVAAKNSPAEAVSCALWQRPPGFSLLSGLRPFFTAPAKRAHHTESTIAFPFRRPPTSSSEEIKRLVRTFISRTTMPPPLPTLTFTRR